MGFQAEIWGGGIFYCGVQCVFFGILKYSIGVFIKNRFQQKDLTIFYFLVFVYFKQKYPQTYVKNYGNANLSQNPYQAPSIPAQQQMYGQNNGGAALPSIQRNVGFHFFLLGTIKIYQNMC